MSRRAVYHLHARFVVDTKLIETVRSMSSRSEKNVWVTTTERLRVYTLKGVASSKLDLLLPDVIFESIEDISSIYVCEIGEKTGSFDGNKRWRITFRTWPVLINKGRLIFEEQEAGLTIIALYDPNGMWAQCFPLLKFTLDERSDIRSIYLWQWKHYFNFLPEDDVRQDAEIWSLREDIKGCDDIVYLNRTSSQMLYERAVQLGWKKLTLRDKRRYGFSDESPQWVKVERIRRWCNGASGAGEYTERAAMGDREYIRTAHGRVDIE